MLFSPSRIRYYGNYMMKWNGTREIPGLALTAARYGMAEHMAQRVRADEPIVAQLATFVAADIADGAILRKFDADTPARRLADGVVDHLSVARVGFEVGNTHPKAKPYIGILAVRAALVGGANLLHLIKTGEVTKGRANQKATNLAMAAFALVATNGNAKATHITGTIASAIAIITAIPHFRDIGTTHSRGMREL